ncbi:MAG: HIT family protein [bacterium]|nr:HIT family protein [bacterium]
MDCIFCKIISGEIPSHKVYENEHTLAFLDIAPVNPGHTLVVSKKHFANLEEADEETLCQAIKTVKKIGKALKDGLQIEGYNVGVNNDPVSGQIIPHLHFHVIPRIKNDGLKLWPQRKYADGEAEKVLEKIRKQF